MRVPIGKVRGVSKQPDDRQLLRRWRFQFSQEGQKLQLTLEVPSVTQLRAAALVAIREHRVCPQCGREVQRDTLAFCTAFLFYKRQGLPCMEQPRECRLEPQAVTLGQWPLGGFRPSRPRVHLCFHVGPQMTDRGKMANVCYNAGITTPGGGKGLGQNEHREVAWSPALRQPCWAWQRTCRK